MASVTITDESGKTLLKTTLSRSGLGRHLTDALSLRGASALVRRFGAPLAETTGEREIALDVERGAAIGKSAELTIGAAAQTSIAIRHAGDEIFPKTDLQAAVSVPNGTIYLCWTLGANLTAGLEGQAGALGFGFNAGSAIRYSYAAPFDAAAGVTVGEAIGKLLETAVMPGDADDLAGLPPGAHVSIAGEGKLSFQAKASLSATTNVLATPSLPIAGVAAISRAASVSMKAGFAMEGDFELRVSRVDARDVRVSFNRRKNRSLTVSAKASAGITATLGDNELIGALRSAVGTDPEADVLGLVDANVSDKQIEALQKAIASSIDRSLSLSAQVEMSSLREEESLFAYDINVEQLAPDGRAAVAEALNGKLSSLGAVAAAGGKGVTVIASAEERLRQRKIAWRLNLFGVLNVAKFSELIAKGSQAFDPISGAFIAADKVTARRILVVGRPGEADAGALRKVMLESLLATAAYQASRALGASVSLTAAHTFVEQHGRATRSDLDEHYRALVGLGLCNSGEADARLGDVREFGASTFVLQNTFDSSACDAMFLDAAGEPRSQAHYETLGRRAFIACLGDDPQMSHRRDALAPDPMWAQLRELGGAIKRALPSSSADSIVKLEVITGDVVTIMWWAMAMHRCAKALHEMRVFLKDRDAATLAADAPFLKQREKLSKALENVIAKSEARFDDPWDALALDAAASGLGALEATVVTSRFSARYSDAAPEAGGTFRSGGGPGASRASRSRSVESRGPAEPVWTKTQQDIFARHVINLRKGALSTGGTVQSSKEQVQRIFRELIPEYAAKADAGGRDPHVIFVAHGGLNSEVDALKHTLAQHRFFLMNGVYPIYFVWETGLKETFADIVGLPTRGRLINEAINLAIERGARRGKAIWDTMKAAAASGAAPGGGSRLAADLAAELWKARGGAIGYHALGHSAGAIFHSHFVPVLVGQKPAGVPPVNLSTLHLLAPAVTTKLFKKQLMKLVGQGQPISQLAMYTMVEELELADPSLPPYGHSLLVLVTRAFEDQINEPVLGLFESLRRDPELIRYFGIRGTSKVADVVFSRTDPAAPLRMRSMSTTHGGFDNDPATMTSLIRRVLDVPDSTAVAPYSEDPVEAAPAAEPVRGRAVAAGPTRSGTARGRTTKKKAPSKKKGSTKRRRTR